MHFQKDMEGEIMDIARSLDAMVAGEGMENHERLYGGLLGRMVAFQVGMVLLFSCVPLSLSLIIGFSPFEHEEIFVLDPLYQSIPVLFIVIAIIYYRALKHRTPANKILITLLMASSWLIATGFLVLVWSLRLAVLGIEMSIFSSSSFLFWPQLQLGIIGFFMSYSGIFNPFRMVDNVST
ncbi:MAG: hypothetical protein GYA24_13665 [Candidatus Lokiarchaeota archaeon]|nr:hypothetical protein [Candidatus Lokiarchaeota archaeon]